MMRRVNRRVRIAIAVAVAGIAAGASTSVFAAKTSGETKRSGQIRLTLRLTGPAPKQQTGGLPGAPGGATTTPGGPAGAAPARRGTFTMSGSFRDHGTVILRLPSLGSTSQESSAVLRSKRGSLRLGLSGGGGSTTAASAARQGSWHVVSGSGVYAGAQGSGTLTPTPRVNILVGALRLRKR
jgi:hypothetical protein